MTWDHWTTPATVIERLRKLGPIGLDPCWNTAAVTSPRVAFDGDARHFFHPAGVQTAIGGDGLVADWFQHAIPGDVIFVNPPFSALEAWRAKCAEIPKPAWGQWHMVLLSPHNPDTLSWRHVETEDAVATFRGRVTYGNPPPDTVDNKPRFATSLAYWGTDAKRFRDVFAPAAGVWRPWREVA